MRETMEICGWEAFNQNSNNCALVFLIRNIKHFAQILATELGKSKPLT
jgi:hypothetical protein